MTPTFVHWYIQKIGSRKENSEVTPTFRYNYLNGPEVTPTFVHYSYTEFRQYFYQYCIEVN
ncbi:hypothetical protein [Marinicellulosiphila megalodicopiae]|uniref:hypothetical protein n=1 Tax=Marinicellulosiphila megalodicopiae TaxID=2724896 RepID=UPI003BAF12BE